MEPTAVSLKSIMGHDVSRRDLLSGFLDSFEKRMAQLDLTVVVDEWKKHTMTIGKAVRVVTANAEICGVAEDIDERGALLIRQEDGSVHRAIYGDCFMQ